MIVVFLVLLDNRCLKFEYKEYFDKVEYSFIKIKVI